MDLGLASALILVLTIAGVFDIRSSRIPNWLTFPAMGFALAGHAWLGGMDGALFSLAGLGAGLGLFLLLYLTGGIGAGDVKLMAAIGAFLGVYGVLSSAWLAIIVGGVYALGAMSYQWGLAATSRKLIGVTYGALVTGGATGVQELRLPFKLRYGLAIAAGTLLFLGGVQPFGGVGITQNSAMVGQATERPINGEQTTTRMGSIEEEGGQ
ncbi:MAG: prepilin peptidase [Nitrospira sp.]|nr:prepilin peptidase [Nitrospira sp.]